MYAKALTDNIVALYLPDPTEKAIRGVSRKFLFDVSTHPPGDLAIPEPTGHCR